MKRLIFFFFSMILTQVIFAQTATTNSLQNAQFKVLGNCGMCKKTIEKAAIEGGATTANWEVNADLLTVTYAEKKTSKDAIQKAVALAGYDNAVYKANDQAYDKLPGCCQYDRTGEAGGTKTCMPEPSKKQ
jgi:copper chaperone CopZ